jgi:hypothetical protein
MRRRYDTRLAGAAIAVLVMAALAGPPAGAQTAEPWLLFGHDNATSATVLIDTTNGEAVTLGATGFASSSSGMAMCTSPVLGTGGITYPAGTMFGLLRDAVLNKDYVTVLDGETGQQTRMVELDLTVSGRGIAFGPDGRTLYALISPGLLYIVGTTDGALTLVGEVRDSAGNQYSGVSLEYDPVSGSFLAFAGPGTSQLIRIDPYTAGATLIAQLANFGACTIVISPGPVAGPGGIVFPAGTWFTINTSTNALHELAVDAVQGRIIENRIIGQLGPAASQVCGTAFGMHVPPTPTATPERTATPGPKPTTAAGSCVCRDVTKQVPPVVIADALANPERFYGWQYPLNPGKPRGPDNPPRECLTLQNVNIPYHPLWNKPIWRVGCP